MKKSGSAEEPIVMALMPVESGTPMRMVHQGSRASVQSGQASSRGNALVPELGEVLRYGCEKGPTSNFASQDRSSAARGFLARSRLIAFLGGLRDPSIVESCLAMSPPSSRSQHKT
jgi:hypothetical protein